MSANTFLAPTGHGLARATQNTNNEWQVKELLTDQDVRCLTADPLNQNVVYAGTQGNGVLRSNDRGQTWHPAGLAGRVIKSLAVSRAQPGTIYAGTRPPHIFVSHDDGATWRELTMFHRIPSRRFWFSPVEKPYIGYVQAIGLSPTNPNIIIAGIEFGAVVRSSDGGQSWTGHIRGALRDCHSLTFHATNGDWAYEGGGTGAGVSVSRDAGATWIQPKAGLDRHYGWSVAADPAHPEVWYATLAPGPFRAHSKDNAHAIVARSTGGAPWQALNGGLPQPLNHMPYGLLTDPAAPGHVYAGLRNGDVWHSTNHGDTWQKLPFSLGSIQSMLLLLSGGDDSL